MIFSSNILLVFLLASTIDKSAATDSENRDLGYATPSPTRAPTNKPYDTPPTKRPTKRPTKYPTKSPTNKPYDTPPTKRPTKYPTSAPTKSDPDPRPPTRAPTKSPTPNGVCIDTADVKALCVANCGNGKGSDCETVCDNFGIAFVSPSQCKNAGNVDGGVGNKKCKAAFPYSPPKRWVCCTCEEYRAPSSMPSAKPSVSAEPSATPSEPPSVSVGPSATPSATPSAPTPVTVDPPRPLSEPPSYSPSYSPTHEPYCSDFKELYGINALCSDNCGNGNFPNCETICNTYQIPYVSPNQCNNVGNVGGVVGNQRCKAEFPDDPPKRWLCCKCDPYVGPK